MRDRVCDPKLWQMAPKKAPAKKTAKKAAPVKKAIKKKTPVSSAPTPCPRFCLRSTGSYQRGAAWSVV